ncbi:Ubiquitin-ligase 2 [Hyphodiscus hymeniophilus]|uniref:Ubiquitin-conjugating enzyme E2 2 n=1 Tax=Hyphodiscus hymeniophilus TaxID=353542 RepID=A0A9P6VNA7_9HELO|nr:Ubiquitin-ligase 2 [Hyphodiscus hymeniophilus]
MEQMDSFSRLSLTRREPSRTPCADSKLTWPQDNGAGAPDLVDEFSSPESTPIMTPETSDDEDEDRLHLPEAEFERSDEAKPLLDVPAAACEWLEGKDPHKHTTTIASSSSNDSDGWQISPKGSPWGLEKEDNLFCAPVAILHHSEDEDEDFHDALLGSELYYGVLISSIRKEDRAALEKVNFATAESRSRMRVHRELRSLHEDETVPYLSVAPIDGNLGNCLACFEGAPETPHEGGIFWLHIDFPEDYPVKPPIITFLTPVYHPNIDGNGRICIDILEKAWSPCLQTQTLLLSILSVLHSPIVENRDETLVGEIAEKYLKDNEDYCSIVRVYTANANGVRPDTSHLVNLTPIEYNPL